jgi:hypothetical protein
VVLSSQARLAFWTTTIAFLGLTYVVHAYASNWLATLVVFLVALNVQIRTLAYIQGTTSIPSGSKVAWKSLAHTYSSSKPHWGSQQVHGTAAIGPGDVPLDVGADSSGVYLEAKWLRPKRITVPWDEVAAFAVNAKPTRAQLELRSNGRLLHLEIPWRPEFQKFVPDRYQ